METTILIADDEVELTLLLRDYLTAEGFRPVLAHDGQTALRLFRQHRVDCVILDIAMPKLNGFDLCRTLRAESDVPILFLSARQSEVDKIRGLGLGADDYVVKPFSPSEVVARVKAQLRRYRSGRPAQPQESVLRSGDLLLNVKAYTATLRGEAVNLTAKEFELLRCLMENPGQVFTRDQLFDRIWGEYGDPHTVTVHIARLREKIGAEWITTLWGIGYRFGGDRP